MPKAARIEQIYADKNLRFYPRKSVQSVLSVFYSNGNLFPHQCRVQTQAETQDDNDPPDDAE